LDNFVKRDKFLEFFNEAGIMTRPVWKLLNELPMYVDCQTGVLKNAVNLRRKIVLLPSGVPN
jgi:dTDP-4-amino-4,6-dideoxygalactose transaminase